ncbi:MAG: hypothetical protein ABFC12_03280 [Methanobacterium sp.]
MKRVLYKAIDYEDRINTLPSSFLLPHRYLSGECPQGGGGGLKIIKAGGGTTYFCPGHQKLFYLKIL